MLTDQRGCGKSTPTADLSKNDTPTLVSDIEELRVHLGVQKWAVVLGGSWGSTLALHYAQSHSSRVQALVLRAVCLMRERDILWLFGSPEKYGGAARLNPQGWKSFASILEMGVASAEDDAVGDAVLNAYARAFNGDNAQARNNAARLWWTWEGAISRLGASLPLSGRPALHNNGLVSVSSSTSGGSKWRWLPQEWKWECDGEMFDMSSVENALVDTFETRIMQSTCDEVSHSNETCVSVEQSASVKDTSMGSGDTQAVRARRMTAPKNVSDGQARNVVRNESKVQWLPAQPMLTCHYSVNRGFASDDALLRGAQKIRHIPCVAVHGGCDLICPPSGALDLLRAYPEMCLSICASSGHSMYDPHLQTEVLDATDRFRDLEKP